MMNGGATANLEKSQLISLQTHSKFIIKNGRDLEIGLVPARLRLII